MSKQVLVTIGESVRYLEIKLKETEEAYYQLKHNPTDRMCRQCEAQRKAKQRAAQNIQAHRTK